MAIELKDVKRIVDTAANIRGGVPIDDQFAFASDELRIIARTAAGFFDMAGLQSPINNFSGLIGMNEAAPDEKIHITETVTDTRAYYKAEWDNGAVNDAGELGLWLKTTFNLEGPTLDEWKVATNIVENARLSLYHHTSSQEYFGARATTIQLLKGLLSGGALEIFPDNSGSESHGKIGVNRQASSASLHILSKTASSGVGPTFENENGRAVSYFPFSDGNVYITGDAQNGTGDVVLRSDDGSTVTTGLTVKAATGATEHSGGIKKPIRETAITTTIDLKDWTILGDAASGNITINLPTAASASGYIFNIKKIDATGNSVTIDGAASETIDGATTQVITNQFDNVQIQSDGTEWHII